MRHLLLFLATAVLAFAHVGSPDIFYEGDAGPYHLLVAIRPPVVIPGIAEVEVRSTSNDVREVHVVPLPLKGPGAKFAPTPDHAKRSKDDPQFYTGGLWMMQFGSWQVRVLATGDKGTGEISIPVPALAVRTSTMQKGIGTILFGLTLFLVIGLVSIVGAGVREAQLEPGIEPAEKNRKRGVLVMAFTFVLVCLLVYLGDKWWDSEADNYARHIYKPRDIVWGARLVDILDHRDPRRRDREDELPVIPHRRAASRRRGLLRHHNRRGGIADDRRHLREHTVDVGTGEAVMTRPDIEALDCVGDRRRREAPQRGQLVRR